MFLKDLNVLKYVKDNVLYNDKGMYLFPMEDMEDDADLIINFYFDLDHGGQTTSVFEYLFKFMEIIKNGKWPIEYDGEWYVVMDILLHNELIDSGVSIRVPFFLERGELAYKDMNLLNNYNKRSMNR